MAAAGSAAIQVTPPPPSKILQRIGGGWISELEGIPLYQDCGPKGEEEIFLDEEHDAELDLVNIYTGIPTKDLLEELQQAK